MNILMVDDEIDILNEINFYVKKYKKFDSSVMCTNPLKALEEAKKASFDIALLDIEMPGMNGLELAEQLQNLFPHMKLGFITAYNSYATEAFDVNAIDYVLKPIREERLIKALDRLTLEKTSKIEKNENMLKFYIQTLGKFVIKSGDNIVKWNRKKSSELFAYLLENQEMPVHKEKLCDLLWPDFEPQKALVNLQSTIYSIRKIFNKYDNCDVSIKYVGDNYILHIEKACIDVVEFEKYLKEALVMKDKTLLKKALDIYIGDYLEEEGWLWAEPRKQELRRKYEEAIKISKKNTLRN
ncbi:MULTISPECIES: response regulator [unclassified Clostridium]|uniref:response regulator n=1 Tax=unclassified Clostridium TaxID=2614128 RepID=UPI0002973CB1|nr:MULTISPECIES: response regulator [unclassified Clostridium]EKQ58289.1 MAG: response regulator (CheY-like receiver and SARP domain containing protein) [Clostridium sp. Maddingley MBC34-26]